MNELKFEIEIAFSIIERMLTLADHLMLPKGFGHAS